MKSRQCPVEHSGANVENSSLRYSLVHDDTNGVIEKALAENDRIKLRVNFVLLEDGEDGHRICGRQRRAEYKAFQ